MTNKGPVTGKTNYENLNVAPATTKNQINGYCNDSAGNLVLNAGCPAGTFTPTYSYDAENRLTTTGGVTYTYDGDGKRVKKSNGMLYWTGTGSDALVETDLSGNTTAEYVFFNGRRIARIDQPANSIEYYYSDHLGSTGVVTSATGGIVKESDYYPYGGEISIITGDSNRYKFTGKERDSESGLDNFGARYDSSSLGRFMTPDWAARPTAVPYAVFGDPQSLNLYGYVRNDPVSRADLDGHQGTEADAFINRGDSSPFSYGFQMGVVSFSELLSLSNAQVEQLRQQLIALVQARQAQQQAQNTGGAQGAVQQQNGAAAQGAGQAGGQQGLQNQQLKFKTVSGGQGATWEIQWSLTHDTKIGGWIVQHFVADFAGAGHYEYWEAWPVPANSHVPSIHGIDASGASYSDAFAGGAGSHAHASARFYEGLTLPSSFKVQPAGFPAGILRATTTNPNLPTQNATAPNIRWWHD